MIGLPGFDEAVVDLLILGNQGARKLVAPLGQGQDFTGSGFGAFEGVLAHQTLAHEVLEFSARLFRAVTVDIEREVVGGNHSKAAEFG